MADPSEFDFKNSEFARRWKAAMLEVWQVINEDPSTGCGPGKKFWRKLACGNVFDRAVKAFGEVNAKTWEEGRTAFFRGRMSPGHETYGESATGIKALRLSFAIASGAWSDIPPHEMSFVSKACMRLPWASPPGHIDRPDPTVIEVKPGDVLPAEAAFTWVQEPRKGIGRRLARAEMLVHLEGVDAIDAPLKYELQSEFGPLEIRKMGDGWFRPVLTPGIWRPVTVGEFVDAARSGVAWRDNPVVARSVSTYDRSIPQALAIDDVAERVTEMTEAERKTVEAYGEKALGRCSRLIVIDDIVWTRIPKPTLEIWHRRWSGIDPFYPPEVIISWIAGSLKSTEPQDTIVPESLNRWDGPSTPTECAIFKMEFPIESEKIILDWVNKWNSLTQKQYRPTSADLVRHLDGAIHEINVKTGVEILKIIAKSVHVDDKNIPRIGRNFFPLGSVNFPFAEIDEALASLDSNAISEVTETLRRIKRTNDKNAKTLIQFGMSALVDTLINYLPLVTELSLNIDENDYLLNSFVM